MHFAQTLDARVVPEWKSQYINYDQGKKLISKLEKSLGPQLGTWNLPPPAQDLPSQTPRIPQQQSQSSGKNAGHSVSMSAPEAARLRQDYGAASAQSARTKKSDRSGSSSRRRKVVDEQSPLLETPATRLYTTPQDVTESSSGSIPMQPMEHLLEGRTATRRQFFQWLNREVSKSNSFYANMEHECRAKLKLLEIQISHFKEHREIHHLERNSGVPKQASSLWESVDFPTLPAVFRGLLPNRDVRPSMSRATAHTADFNNKDDHVSYYQAKGMLRIALSEFYQSLLHLRGFRQLNETAMRKIVKKFDKQLRYNTLDKYLDETKNLAIRSSDTLEQMIKECEYLYADNFTRGNHKTAVDSLNIKAIHGRKDHDTSVLATGFFIGGAIPLIVLALYSAIHTDMREHPEEVHYILQMYGGFACVGLAFLGFGVALTVWTHFRINYSFIIELDRSSMLDYRQYSLLPSMYALFLGLCGWLTFNTVQPMHRYYPCLFLGLFGVGLGLPFGPYWNSRRWLLHSLWRLVFSGLYSVEFRDLLMGDIFCSLTYSMSSLELFFCVYSTPHWWSGEGAQHALRCTSRYSRSMGFLSCLPGIWRFLQCWRRYADTLDWFPHLLNAGKYTFTILYNMSLSIARISPDNSNLKAMFIVFALGNGLYTGIWDVVMDFSLSPTPELRSVLVFPKWMYWCIIILDPLMRQNWVLYVIFWKHKQQGALISFVVALIEIIRRIMWAMFRVENEHAANIAKCRAFKDLNLPYEDLAEIKKLQSNMHQDPEYRSEGAADGDGAADSGTSPGGGSASIRIPHNSGIITQGSAPTSAFSSPSLRRSSTFSALSPRIQFAHTNDFQRRKPKASEEREAAEEEEDDEQL